MRKDIENELLKYGMGVNLLNKSELARRMNCSRQTINSKLKKVNKQTNKKKRSYISKLDNFKDIIETKGKVEVLAKIMNRLKVYNGEFSNQYNLIKIVEDMNISLNNEIVLGINQKPIDRFQKEKNTLNPVNIEILKPYFIRQKEYKVSNESMITYKGKKYSVPTAYIGKYVTVTEGDSTIYIYYTTNFICSYDILVDCFLNFKEEHYKEILSKSAYGTKTDVELD